MRSFKGFQLIAISNAYRKKTENKSLKVIRNVFTRDNSTQCCANTCSLLLPRRRLHARKFALLYRARRRQKLQSTSIRKHFRYELGKLAYTLTCPSSRDCKTKVGLFYDEAKTFRSLQIFPETLRFSEIAY